VRNGVYNSVRKLNVVLGDLQYYNRFTKFVRYVPLNIGFIASYLKYRFGSDVNIKLFKEHEAFLSHCNSEKVDIVGLSFYYWNTDLNIAVTKKVKEYLGPNVPIKGVEISSQPPETHLPDGP
jgi:hypothetical protein